MYHVETLDSSIEVQGNSFLMQINFYFATYGDIFFDAFLFCFDPLPVGRRWGVERKV